MAGRCKKRTIKFAKWAAQLLTPIGVKLVRDLVVIAEKTGMNGNAKRAMVIAATKAALGDVKEYAIRAAIEATVGAMDSIETAAVDEIGDVDEADLADTA